MATKTSTVKSAQASLAAMFGNAPEVVKTKAKAVKPSYTLPGVDELAAIDAAQKALEGLRKGYEAQVKTAALNIYADQAMKTGLKPESFVLNGEAGDGTATYVFASLGSNMGLDSNMAELLKTFKIPFNEAVDTFQINTKVSGNPVALAKLAKALAKVDLSSIEELAGESLILKVPGKITVTPDTIPAVCRIRVREQMMALLPALGISKLTLKFLGKLTRAWGLVEEAGLPVSAE